MQNAGRGGGKTVFVRHVFDGVQNEAAFGPASEMALAQDQDLRAG